MPRVEGFFPKVYERKGREGEAEERKGSERGERRLSII
jgi:hypothetical protein